MFEGKILTIFNYFVIKCSRSPKMITCMTIMFLNKRFTVLQFSRKLEFYSPQKFGTIQYSLYTIILVNNLYTFLKVIKQHATKVYTRVIKNIFNINERRCRDIKTQKACEQGWEATIGPKIKQTTSF